jgi:hypothetical protein
MKNMNKKGTTSTIVIAVVVAAVLIIGGIVFYQFHEGSSSSANLPLANNSSTTVATSGEPISPGTGLQVPSSTPTFTTPTPSASSLAPNSGTVGSTVTIHGSGFEKVGNTVTLNNMVSASLDNLSSPDGKTIQFIVPSSLGPNCKPNEACPAYALLVTNGNYSVAVISNGVTQHIDTFTVTGKPFQVP